MSRRNVVRIVSFSLSIALCFAITAFKLGRENQKLILQTQNSYSYRLNELNAATDNISVLLNKARFVTSPQKLNGLGSQILTEAELSKAVLAQIPTGSQMIALNKFLSQVGNFVFAAANDLQDDGTLTPQNTAALERLWEMSVKVAKAVSNSKYDLDNLDFWSAKIENDLKAVAQNSKLDQSLNEIEEGFADYPKLIFDGPYSDSILDRSPQMLINTASVTRQQAAKNAARFAGVSVYDLDFAGSSKGKIPTFDYMSEGLTVSVSQKGGYVVFMRKHFAASEISLDYKEALTMAHKFLQEMELFNFKETYYYEADGVCTFNFAYTQGQTVCYSDLIKVGVSMENGDIVFYEASGFITNHRNRNIKIPEKTVEQATEKVSGKLQITDTRECLIPTEGGTEEHCYEFTCRSADGQDILVYINTATLKEEEILILLKSDGGTLVK